MDNFRASAAGKVGRLDWHSQGSPPLLVGRSEEQEFLRAVRAEAFTGRGQLVLIGGEAGIGKTTMARDLIRSEDARTVIVLSGSCFDLTNTPPYGPWIELFDDCRRREELPNPPTFFTDGRLEGVTDQAALFSEVRRFLLDLTSDRPALLLLEDLHWADPASIDLLRYLGPHFSRLSLLLLVTYRIDELSPSHPLAQQMPALVREAGGLRLDLRPLDPGALRALVTATYGLEMAAEDRLVAYLERHAEGNPFFAAELLRALEGGEQLQFENGRWSLAAIDRVVVPALLRQVIFSRVARLDDTTRRALAIAAIIGQEVPIALWGEVAELEEEALLIVIERAVDAHLLEVDREGIRARFVHALIRESIYDGVLAPRRRSWHRRVAERLIVEAEPDPDAIAFHLQEAGDSRVVEWLIRAGDRAQRSYAWRTAAERLRAAADHLTDVEGDALTRARLLHGIALLARFSDPAGAIADCLEAERLASRAGDVLLAVETRYARSVILCYAGLGRQGLATMLESIDSLEAMPFGATKRLAAFRAMYISHLVGFLGTTEPPTAADELAAERLHDAGQHWLRCMASWEAAWLGRPQEAAATLERYLDILAPGFDATDATRYIAAFAHHGLGMAYAALARPNDARRALANSRTIFRDVGHHVLVAFTLCNELWDIVYPFGTVDAAGRRRIAAEAEAALGRAGGALRPGLTPRIASLSCCVLDGRWDEADLILADLPDPGNAVLRREVSGPRAVLARHRGESEIAWREIRSLLPGGPATEPGDISHQEGLFFMRLAAELRLDSGELSASRGWLEVHDRWLAWSESVLGRADGQLAWARYYRETGEYARTGQLAYKAIKLATGPNQPLVLLAAHRLIGELNTIERRFDDASSHLATALSLADSCEVPFERALTLLTLADLRMDMGSRVEAAEALNEARRICVPLRATPTLLKIDKLDTRIAIKPSSPTNSGGLTVRELEVLQLLVSGQSNFEIAETLFISRDTARTHVANIFRKLDVSSRAEAVDRAHRLGLVTSPPST